MDEKISGWKEDFLKEVLKNHPKYEEKIKDFDYFTIGYHPEYQNSKCFLIMKTDGTVKDFSYKKTLAKLFEPKED